MCGRFTLRADEKTLKARFPALPAASHLRARYNIGPGQPVGAWLADPQARWEWFSWGLIPHWATSPPQGGGWINARAETAAEKPAFRDGWRRRRCLVPADGWYEWRREGKVARPHFFSREDGAPFAFAGIADAWHDGAGGVIVGLALLTTRPNRLARQVHHRMPVILREEDEGDWLDPCTPLTALTRMMEPVAGDGFTVREVSQKVNAVRNEGPSLLEPLPPRPSQGELF